jgi:O-antigen/teichoic acid export membrane protein
MLEKILRLGKDTATYGLSTVVGRLFNFLVVPLYANTLLPAENGVIATVYAYIAFATVVYGIGMEQTFMRFYALPEIGDKKQNFSLPFLMVCGSSFFFSLCLFLGASSVAQMIGLGANVAPFLRYASGILLFDALSIIPFALLRMEQKIRSFALLRLFNIMINLLLNIILIVWLDWGMEGVFAANLIASGLTAAALTPLIGRNIHFTFPRQLLPKLLRFGLPLIPAGLAGIALQVVDRPIVKALTNDASLGIYQLNYRLGIIMMLVVGMFDFAWRPFFLAHAKDADAKPLFVRVFTLLVLGLSTVFVVVSLFISDIVQIQLFGKQFFPPIYLSGLNIVPWVLLAYVFTGLYACFVVGVYLEKQTKYIPMISGAAALINIGADILLIPKYGILGAAWATTIAYAAMAFAMFRVSQKFYPLSYEWSKILRIAAAVVTVFLLHQALSSSSVSINALPIKSGLVVLFLAMLFVLRVVSFSDVTRLRQSLFESGPPKPS